MRILAAALSALVVFSSPARSQWTHAERVDTYAVSGTTGIELYRSIGERGPKAGAGRAIAFTTYELTWRRDYRPENGGCRLASATPRLTVVYKLPRPSTRPEGDLAGLWDRFIKGIEAHERIHGDIILETVRAIEAATVGLTVAGDKGCKTIRAEVQAKIAALAADMRRRNAEFDKVEMSKDGNVHRLILGLVNG